jgi:hypothetical protein
VPVIMRCGARGGAAAFAWWTGYGEIMVSGAAYLNGSAPIVIMADLTAEIAVR